MLFIIVHQAYELWFKQILHELDRIQADFGGEVLEDEYLGRIVHGLDRINEILKLLIQQLEVLETMTPLDFLDFRDFLFPASGFQSVQFRMIEIRLGLSRDARLNYADKPFDDTLDAGRQSPRRRGRARSEADRPARPVAVAHPVRAPARLRFLARLPQGGAAHARGRRGARARQRRDEPGAARGRGAADRGSLQEFQAIFAPGAGRVAVADVARRRCRRRCSSRSIATGRCCSSRSGCWPR